jgi:hypothetical protein
MVISQQIYLIDNNENISLSPLSIDVNGSSRQVEVGDWGSGIGDWGKGKADN